MKNIWIEEQKETNPQQMTATLASNVPTLVLKKV